MTKQEIEFIIAGLRESYEFSNIEDLIHMLDINLYIIPHNTSFLYGQHACFIRNGDEESIFISDTCPDELRSFALAHELGHAILHDVELVHLAIHKKETRLEKEADYFATKLLDIEFDIVSYQGYSVEDFAGLYGINESAVTYIIDQNNRRKRK